MSWSVYIRVDGDRKPVFDENGHIQVDSVIEDSPEHEAITKNSLLWKRLAHGLQDSAATSVEVDARRVFENKPIVYEHPDAMRQMLEMWEKGGHELA